MKLIKRCTLPVLMMLLAMPSPGTAKSIPSHEEVQQLKKRCLEEAEWPLLNSSKYKNAAPRRQQQLKNGHNPEIVAMRRVCLSITAKSEATRRQGREDCRGQLANKMRRYGEQGKDHVVRIGQMCEITVEVSDQ